MQHLLLAALLLQLLHCCFLLPQCLRLLPGGPALPQQQTAAARSKCMRCCSCCAALLLPVPPLGKGLLQQLVLALLLQRCLLLPQQHLASPSCLPGSKDVPQLLLRVSLLQQQGHVLQCSSRSSKTPPEAQQAALLQQLTDTTSLPHLPCLPACMQQQHQ